MINDVILNKLQTIKKCLMRIDEEYAQNPDNLKNFTKQDSIVLNLQRACEASIDIAMHLIAENKWGIPQTSRDAFDTLFKNRVLDDSLNRRLKTMVGFRNIAVHDYQSIQLPILQSIIEIHLTDFMEYSDCILNFREN